MRLAKTRFRGVTGPIRARVTRAYEWKSDFETSTRGRVRARHGVLLRGVKTGFHGRLSTDPKTTDWAADSMACRNPDVPKCAWERVNDAAYQLC